MTPLLLGLLNAQVDEGDLSFNRGLEPIDQNRISKYIRKWELEDVYV